MHSVSVFPVLSEQACSISNHELKPLHRWHSLQANAVGLGLVQRYLKGEAYIVLVFRPVGSSRNFAALLQCREAESAILQKIRRAGDRGCIDHGGNESPMLIEIVKLMQSPEVAVSSSVYAKPVDDGLSFLPHTLHLSVVSGYLLCGGWDLIGYRKSRRDSLGISQIPCEIVKRTVEIMDNVSDNQWDIIGNGFNVRDAIDELSRYRILITDDLIRVTVPKSMHHVLQFQDMLIGPVDL